MNKILNFLFYFIIFYFSIKCYPVTKYGTIITNISKLDYEISNLKFITNITNFLQVGKIYGISKVIYNSNYNILPAQQLKIPLKFTNNGNDADNNVYILLDSLSYSENINIKEWDIYFEVKNSNVGTNYHIPYIIFGEGAIFDFNLVVNAPISIQKDSFINITIKVQINTNSNHIAGFYTGFNGILYGGYSSCIAPIRINTVLPDIIKSIYAEDGISVISKFDGTEYLRVSKNKIYVKLFNKPSSFINLYYSIDNGINNLSDIQNYAKKLEMKKIDDLNYYTEISEANLKNGKMVYFCFNIDNTYYLENYFYKLTNFGYQDYKTILMNNIIDPLNNFDDKIYLKIPEEYVSKPGKIIVYSVSGEFVNILRDDVLNIDEIIFKWDGKDYYGNIVKSGVYYFVIDIDNIKEIRKVFIK